MRAKYIARQLGVDRTNINRILYANINNPFIRNNNFEWTVNSNFQVKHESYLPTQNLINQWKELMLFITQKYNENPKLFTIEVVNFRIEKDLSRMIAELEIYVMHLLLHIQFSPYEEYIEIDDIQEIIMLLNKALNYDYSNNLNIQQFLMKKFLYEDTFIIKLLDSLIRYDESNRSLVCYEFIKMIEVIGLNICQMNDNQPHMNLELNEIIKSLKKYASSHKNFFVQAKDTFVRCQNCHERILESNAETDGSGNYYCDDCKDLINEDDDFDIDYIDGEDEDYYFDEDEEEDEKDEIIEDCTTCFHKKNGSCTKAYLNFVCEKYKYKG